MEEPQSPEKPQRPRSRARERVQRRKARRGSQPTASSTTRKRPTRQIARPDRMKIPNIAIPYLRQIALGILGLIFMGVLILGVGLFKSEPIVTPSNAIWIGEEWTYEAHSVEEINAFVDLLKDNEIGYIYAWVSFLRPNNTWAGGSSSSDMFASIESQVSNFVEQLSDAYPEGQIYGWIRIPATSTENSSNLADEVVRNSVSDFSEQVVNRLGFDGVFVDASPVFDNDNDYLGMLQRIRSAIGQNKDLVIAAPPDWTPIDVDVPTPTVIAQGTVWSDEYKQRVTLLADQLVIQVYNSYLTNAADYSEWVAYQVATYARVVDELNTATQVIISVPVYENDLPAHDTTVENLTSALTGVQIGIAQAGDSAFIIDGLAIYAEWAMEARDWAIFNTGWLNQ